MALPSRYRRYNDSSFAASNDPLDAETFDATIIFEAGEVRGIHKTVTLGDFYSYLQFEPDSYSKRFYITARRLGLQCDKEMAHILRELLASELRNRDFTYESIDGREYIVPLFRRHLDAWMADPIRNCIEKQAAYSVAMECEQRNKDAVEYHTRRKMLNRTLRYIEGGLGGGLMAKILLGWPEESKASREGKPSLMTGADWAIMGGLLAAAATAALVDINVVGDDRKLLMQLLDEQLDTLSGKNARERTIPPENEEVDVAGQIFSEHLRRFNGALGDNIGWSLHKHRMCVESRGFGGVNDPWDPPQVSRAR